ncbi:MAG TPA: hypothetical protein VJ486_11935 [Geothrix sp.]|nr:hypothetical protein [Geothrix sp.]
MLRCLILALLAGMLGLSAQDARSFKELSLGTNGCPRTNEGASGAHRLSGARPMMDVLGTELFAKGARRQAQAFGVLDKEGLLQTLGSQKGSIVAIGFWSTRCEPSMKMLQEFRNFQKQTANRKMNLVFWPVHFEPWPEVLSFLRTKNQYFDGVEVKRLGIGEHGLSQITDTLNVLPTVFLFDKEGGLAATWTGYQENLLLTRINKLLAER